VLDLAEDERDRNNDNFISLRKKILAAPRLVISRPQPDPEYGAKTHDMDKRKEKISPRRTQSSTENLYSAFLRKIPMFFLLFVWFVIFFRSYF
jgi:hypothetical protein